MIERRIHTRLIDAIDTSSAVALHGPRQVGKTSLAHGIAPSRPSVYLDLESWADLARLGDAETYLGSHEGELVILDEVHRAPEPFQQLRGLADRGRRSGLMAGRSCCWARRRSIC